METSPNHNAAEVVARYLGLDTSLGNFALVATGNGDISLSGLSSYKKDLHSHERCRANINLPLRQYALRPVPPIPYTINLANDSICLTRMIHVEDKKIAVVLSALALIGYNVEPLPTSLLTNEQQLAIKSLVISLEQAANLSLAANDIAYSKL